MRVESVEAENIELNKVHLHLYVEGMKEALRFGEKLNSLKGEDVDITVDKHRQKRSKNANDMLWSCIGDIAKELGADKNAVYLQMLRSYGKYTYICVPPQAVDAVKKQWRETEELGDININGKQAKQLLCYFGSSTYNSREFAKLLDGVIEEMHNMGLETPSEKDERLMLEKWAKEVEESG